MIERLFRSDVVSVVAKPEMWAEELHPDEAAFVSGAVAKRRREFAAGRSCAREALRILGFDGHSVLVGPHREPLWPGGIVGSLTHCEGYCAAVAAREDRVAGLGVDAELGGELDPDLIPLVCTSAEIEWVRGNQPPPHGDWHKIIFSAKESVYKCLFPFVRRILDFQEVEIQFHPPESRFSARFLFDPPDLLARAPAVCGRFETGSEYVVTGVTFNSLARSTARSPLPPFTLGRHAHREQ